MKLGLLTILILISFSLDCVSTDDVDEDIPSNIVEPADQKDLQMEVKEDISSMKFGGTDDF